MREEMNLNPAKNGGSDVSSQRCAFFSASAFKLCSPESMVFCSVFCIALRNIRGSVPFHDSSVLTIVLSPFGSSSQTWTAFIPRVFPVQANILGRSTCWRVDMIVPGPAFHRKVDPFASSPSRDADFTSGFQAGHRSMSAITAQTVSMLAAISISPAAKTGAFLLISISATNSIF